LGFEATFLNWDGEVIWLPLENKERKEDSFFKEIQFWERTKLLTKLYD